VNKIPGSNFNYSITTQSFKKIETMKKLFYFFALLLISTGSFSQQNQSVNIAISGMPAVAKSRHDQPIKISEPNDYLRKSRTQKTFAWILAGIGTVCIIMPLAGNNSGDSHSWINFDQLKHDLNTLSYLTGAVFIGASIPLFIAGHRNKLRAEGQVGLMRLSTPQWSSSNMPHAFPSAGIKIYFK
jgi:hypothetical protein